MTETFRRRSEHKRAYRRRAQDVAAKAGHVTLKHGAVENMNMGPMTMAFAVKDKSTLSNLKEGSKVKFAVENVDSVPTVTLLVPQK